MRTALVLLAAILTLVSATRAEDLRDSESLAAGYAKAFECSGKSTIAIIYVGGTETETIADVKEVLAVRGVLLIKTFNGSRQILDPARVVKMVTN